MVTETKIFLGFGCLFGLIFLFLTPPFQVPDETIHFYRAYQTSQGLIVGATLPSSMVVTASRFNGLPFHPEKKTSYQEIISVSDLPLEPQTVIPASNIAYPPLAYLPQAVGIRLGVIFNLSPLHLMYLGRLLNLAIWLFLVAMALQRTPIFKWLFCLLALSPMSLFEAASLSRDPWINGASLLLVAYYLDGAHGGKNRLQNRDLLRLFLLLLLVSLPKSVYAVLGLMFLIIPISKVGSKKKYYGYFFLTMGLLGAILFLGNYFFFHARPPSQDFFSWQERFHFIFSHPFGFLEILLRSFLKNGGEYLEMFIGVLGWLDTPLPEPVWLFYGFVLMLLALLDKDTSIVIPRNSKLILFGAFLLGVLAIMTAMYLAIAPEKGVIAGVQGRYFIPLAPLFFLLFYNQRIRLIPELERTLGKLVVGTSAIVLSAASYVIFARYYL